MISAVNSEVVAEPKSRENFQKRVMEKFSCDVTYHPYRQFGPSRH